MQNKINNCIKKMNALKNNSLSIQGYTYNVHLCKLKITTIKYLHN